MSTNTSRTEPAFERTAVAQDITFWQRLVEPTDATRSQDARRRARLLSTILLLLMAAMLLSIVSRTILRGQVPLSVVGGGVVVVVAYALSRTRYFEAAVGLTLAALVVPVLLSAGSLEEPDQYRVLGSLVWLVLPMLVASMLLRVRSVLATVGGIIVATLLLPAVYQTLNFGDLGVTIGYMIVIAALIAVIAVIRQRDFGEVVRRVDRLRATADVSQAASTTLDMATLLDETIHLISRTFGFYHVQVFLLDDDRRNAVLRASMGDAGQQLLARRHHLPVGGQSVIGQVTSAGRPVIAQDTNADVVHRPNPLLPLTRSEMALPLRVAERVIGALDVQSVQADAFTREDVDTLQVMANQLAITIDHTRLFAQLDSRAQENERLLEEARANLREIEELNRTLTREGWREYMGTRSQRQTMGYTLEGEQVVFASDWTGAMRQAFDKGDVVAEPGQGQAPTRVALPVRVRGEVVGVVEVERDGDWSADDLQMAQALIDRFAVALDNARLLEQAGTLARREQMVNEITHSMQAAATVDDVLQSALRELGQALGAERGVVQLRSTRKAPAPQQPPTSQPELPVLADDVDDIVVEESER